MIFKKLILCLPAAWAGDKPNVIVLITDDFGIGDFSIYNKNSKVPTPNIDRLGHEGVKFLDGHSGSSRCAPSRYMLMTGRYSLQDSPARKLHFGTPHMAEMFKRTGYQTGIFGKYQPLYTQLVNTNVTETQLEEQLQAKEDYNKATFGAGGHKAWMVRGMFDVPGNYELAVGPNNHSYDYSFTSSSLCCQPGAFYENGKGIEPVSKYLIQEPYPEGDIKESSSDPVTGKCNEHPTTGFMGGTYYDEPVLDGPFLHCNFPKLQLAMPSFDSRTIDDVVLPKALNYISEKAAAEEPFFMYYGMRSGHRPFNTPIRFRGKSQAGIVGEMIMEADEIVGRILDQLAASGIDDDTIVLFMSDNGADGSAFYAEKDFGHLQHGVDINDESIKLRGQKNFNYEAGHRLPFLWRYPARWQQRVVDDPTMPVSYLDVYRTLGDIIGAEIPCNEAPDSRSILSLLDGTEPTDQLKNSKIITHAKKGARLAFRKRQWKWIPEDNALFNLEKDVTEEFNLVEYEWGREFAQGLNESMNSIVDFIANREDVTQEGKIAKCFLNPFDSFQPTF